MVLVELVNYQFAKHAKILSEPIGEQPARIRLNIFEIFYVRCNPTFLTYPSFYFTTITTMPSDDESIVSSLPSDLFTTSIAKSTVSKASSMNPPARNTRFFEKRIPVLPKPTKLTNAPDEAPNEGTPTEIDSEKEDHQDLGSEAGLLHLQTPGPGSSVSQTFSSETKSERSRPKTSWIHQHLTAIWRNDVSLWQCNYCSKFYKVSGGSGAFIKHLRNSHHIDPQTSSIARKRDANGTAVNIALLRQAESSQVKKEDNQIQEYILNKATLEYLYIR